MIRRVKRVKVKKRFTPVRVENPVKTGDELEYIFLPPLQPRKKLLIISSIAFVIWVGCLIAMYVTTVYPQRHRVIHPVTQPAARAEPTTVPTTMAA